MQFYNMLFVYVCNGLGLKSLTYVVMQSHNFIPKAIFRRFKFSAVRSPSLPSIPSLKFKYKKTLM